MEFVRLWSNPPKNTPSEVHSRWKVFFFINFHLPRFHNYSHPVCMFVWPRHQTEYPRAGGRSPGFEHPAPRVCVQHVSEEIIHFFSSSNLHGDFFPSDFFDCRWFFSRNVLFYWDVNRELKNLPLPICNNVDEDREPLDSACPRTCTYIFLYILYIFCVLATV